MGKERRYKLYAVSKGRQPGIYDSWCLAEKQVTNFKGAVHKGFGTQREAINFMAKANISQPQFYIAVPTPSSSPDEDTVSANVTTPSKSPTVDGSNKNEAFVSRLTTATTSTGMNKSTSAALESSTDNLLDSSFATTADNAGTCANCSVIAEALAEVTARLTKLEQQQYRNTPTWCGEEDSLHPPTEDRMAKIEFKLTQIEQSLDTKIEELKRSIIESYAAKTALASDTSSATLKPTQTSRQSFRQSTASAPINSKPSPNRGQIKFDPLKCIVICNIPKETAVQLNQDDVRKAINVKFGPTMIDIVNRYKFRTEHPKFIVQFADPSIIANIVDNWDTTIFTNSTVRKTIAPKDEHHIGMVRDVPTDIADEELTQMISSQFSTTDVYRLRSEEGPLRTVKVTFADEESQRRSLSSGVLISSHNLLLRVEKPYPKQTNHG